MNTLAWQFFRWGRILGMTGLVGVAMLVAALVLQFIQVETSHRATIAQQTTLAALRHVAASQAVVPRPQPVNPLSALPPTGEAAQQIGALEQLAHAYGLELPRGQYSVAQLTGIPLLRWQLILPIEASYPALHGFLAAALERQPNLTLDELKLKRDSIETDVLQTELRMSLFVEAAP